MPKRFLVVEEALRNREGHWFEYNRATKSALLAEFADAEVIMLGNATMEKDLSTEIDAIPHFRFTVWDDIYNYRLSILRYFGVLHHNLRLYAALKSFLIRNTPFDMLFAPTVVLHHLIAYRLIASKFQGKRFGFMALLIRNSIANYDSAGNRSFKGTSVFWRWAIQSFQPLINRNEVRFLTDSDILAQEYKALTGVDFEVLPHPSLVSLNLETEQKGISRGSGKEEFELRVFLPGPSRYEKGSDILVEAMRLLGNIKLSIPIRFVFQWSEPFRLPDNTLIGPDVVPLACSQQIRAEVFRKPLSSDEYRNQLLLADIIILPYRQDAYAARISGVAVEAMLLSKPLIYTEGTWTESVAKRFGIGVPTKADPLQIASAVQTIALNLENFREDARLRSREVASYFSPTKFVKTLCQPFYGR